MRKTGMAVVLCLVCAGISAEQSPRLNFDSYGSSRVGMTLTQMQSAFDEKIAVDDPSPTGEACQYSRPVASPDRVAFMMIDHHMARIDVMAAGISTTTGIHVGSFKQDVLAAYPNQVDIQPHAYLAPEGEYLTVYSPDHRFGIRFETDHDRVTAFYAGTAQAIQYIEGCL